MATTIPPPVHDGEIIAGKYRVERTIGQGAHGVVVAARHVELDESVAIKVLRRKSAKNPAIVERFLREARASVRLKSEHVVRIFDVGKLEDGVPYIVMEHLRGRDLEKVLAERGRVPASEAVAYVMQACEAIAEAHSLGIVHRDLKLSNLFLADRARGAPIVKVLDFGVAKWKDAVADPDAKRLTSDSTGIGSPLYMSPEQITDPTATDERADVWSLGVILHELIAGSPPFDAPTVEGVLAAVLTSTPKPLRQIDPGVPVEIERTVVAALTKDRAARTPTVADFALAIARFAPGGEALAADWATRAPARPVALTDPGPIAATADPRAATMHDAAVPTIGEHRGRLTKMATIALAVAALAVLAVAASYSSFRATHAAPAASSSSPLATRPLPEPEPVAESSSPPPAESVVVAEPAAAPGPAASASAGRKAQAPAARGTVSPSAKPSTKTDDVRHLIDGRR